MLERLLETGSQRKKSAWGAAASVIVHGTIISLAVAATAIAKSPPRAIHRDRVFARIDLPADDRPVRQRAGSRKGTAHGPLTPPRIPLPGTTFSIDAPIITSPPTTDVPGVGTSALAEIGGAGGDGTTTGGGGVASDARVDVPVHPLGDRAPAYPETLRTAGITGTVRVRFVVDTTGRAEPSSIRVLESTH